ncbi:MAG TPA: helix-turn-helix domain-containing protein [Fimbriimonadaceae bacterium]|nr:helix-turn-helix domain-containing protein [Fimbriimonadaceae bacterium]
MRVALLEVKAPGFVIPRNEGSRQSPITHFVPLCPPWPRTLWASKAAIVLRDVGRGEMSIDWLAGKLEMSRRSLERRFADQTGLSPADWRREARLIEALRLLAMGRGAT